MSRNKLLYFLVIFFCPSFAYLPNFEVPQNNKENILEKIPLEILHLKYRRASDIANTIMKNNQITLIADDHSNQIWIRSDHNKDIAEIKKIISGMDKPEKQISIAVKMMAIDTDTLKEIGFHANSKKTESHQLINIKHISWWLDHLDIKISNGLGEMIASPTLLVSNHSSASIESGQEIPYQEKNHDGDISTHFKNATLELSVRPDLLPQQEVILNIHLKQDKLSELTVAGMPAIQTEKINTAIQAKNNQTVVLGGIYTHHLTQQKSGIAFLSKLPLLGPLFQHHYWSWRRQELVIFVTPHW